MKELQLDKLKYVVRYPKGFSEENKYPVIVVLHGAGSRGDTVTKLVANPFFAITEKQEEFPFICVAPLCSENTWFDLLDQLKKLVAEVAKLPYVDSECLYLMGPSMGGYATWQLAMSIPEYFAAIVPMCGGGMYWNAGRLVNVPVWAFHGAKDNTVLLEESVKMVNGVNRWGGEAKLTVYPEGGHDAWSDTYSNPDVFAWLLEHRNKNINQYVDEYNKADIYG